MTRRLVTSAMSLARLTASSYVRSENGATSPGRWQVAQFWYRIGAMSLLYVGVAALAVAAARIPNNDPAATLMIAYSFLVIAQPSAFVRGRGTGLPLRIASRALRRSNSVTRVRCWP